MAHPAGSERIAGKKGRRAARLWEWNTRVVTGRLTRAWPGRLAVRQGAGEHPDGWPEFERYCRAAFPAVAAQLHAMVGDRARAHRLAHGAFAEAWLHWGRVSALADRTGWVRRRAVRQIRWSQRCRAVTGLLRRRRSDQPGAVGLLAVLARLPSVQRRALVLHHMAGLSSERLAEEENTSTKVVLQRLEHGRLALGHRAASGDWAEGDADVRAGQWAIAPIEDWVARQFTYLEYRLTPLPDTRSVFIAARTARRRRQATAVAGAGIILAAGFGTAVAATLSPSGPAAVPLAPVPHPDGPGPVGRSELPFVSAIHQRPPILHPPIPHPLMPAHPPVRHSPAPPARATPAVTPGPPPLAPIPWTPGGQVPDSGG
jgi:RNA polymerase sigma-70 factor (ECF subfamily)